MAAPIASVSGLSSGIQWRDLVDQIIAADAARAVTPLQLQSARRAAQAAAWNDFGELTSRLRDALNTLADGSVFRSANVSVGLPPSGGLPTVSVNRAGATPGSYSVEVKSLAANEKTSGIAVTDATAALGVSGQITVNGIGLTIGAADSLNDVRDRINGLNAGATATKVGATVVTASGISRLVLTSDVTGARGVELADIRTADGAPSALAGLGLVDSAASAANIDGDGRTLSGRFSSATDPVATALGVTMTAGNVAFKVNGKTVSFDPTTTSISDLASAINAVSPGAASTESVTSGAATWTRLRIAGTVTTDGTEGSTRLLESLGLFARSRAAAASQSVTTGSTLKDAGVAATAASLLTDLGTGASPAGIQVGDTFNVTGRAGNGTSVQRTVTVTGGMTVDNLLDEIEAAYAGSRAVSAQIVNGQIVVTDTVSGSSQLSFAITAGMQSGTIDFGTSSTAYGHERQITAGADAEAVIDGVRVTGSSNVLAGALGGATLTLTRALPGETSTVTVTSDRVTPANTAKAIADAYNAMAAFVKQETAANGRLAHNASVRASLDSLRAVIVGDVQGLGTSPTYPRAASVGLSITKEGTLSFDSAVFTAALESDPDAVVALFKTQARATNPTVQFVTAGSTAPVGEFALAITQAATRSSIVGASLGAYAGGGTPASMSVTDSVTGKTATISLLNGDTVDGIVGKLAARFSANGMHVSATNSGGKLSLSSMDYGSTSSFTVSYTDPGAEDPATQLGITAGSVQNGVNAAGTLDGVAMTASGQVLTSQDGLVLRYAGTTDVVNADVTYALGLGGALKALTTAITTPGSGLVDTQATTLENAQTALDSRATLASDRLERRRAALLKQFAAMERALGNLQSQGQWLTAQLNSLSAIAPGNQNR